MLQLQPRLINIYCLVPVKVKFAFNVRIPTPVVVTFAGITELVVQTQASEQVMSQFPEPGAVQVSAGQVVEL